MTSNGRAQYEYRHCCTRAFAKPHIEVKQRLHSELPEQRAMPGFSRNMTRKCVVEPVGPQLSQRRCGCSADEPVQDDRNTPSPRRKRSAQDGGKFPSAHGCRSQQRIANMACMKCKRAIDHGPLARQSSLVNAGSMSRPLRAVATEQSGRQSGRCSSIADPHLTETHE